METTNEALRIGDRKNYDLGSQLQATLNHSINGKFMTAKLSSKNSYNVGKLSGLVNDLKMNLVKTLREFLDNKTSPTEFASRTRKLLKEAHEESYLRGMKAGGFEGDEMPESDRKWLTASRYDEYQYLNKFVTDMTKGKGWMDYFERITWYANAVYGSYNAGRNSVIPRNMLSYWRLESKSPRTGHAPDHCPTCLHMAERSPWTPSTLPIVPRGGQTLCIQNCLCQIVYVHSTPDKVRDTIIRNGSTRETLAHMKKLKVVR